MNSLLLWLGGLMVAVFAALFSVPYFVDWNSYRGVFEEEATRFLGRKVRVGGSVNLSLLPVPYVRFEQVRIADDTGTLGAPFFSADGFTLWLSVPPLLRGVLEAKQVELERPVLNLSVDKAGGGNWRTFKIAAATLPFVPQDVALQSMKISNGRLSLRLGGGGKESIVLSGIDGDLSADALHGPYRFQGDADFEHGRHEIRLSTGQSEDDGAVRLKTVVRSSGGTGTYVVDGTLRDLTGDAKFNGSLSAKVPLVVAGVSPESGGAGDAAARDGAAKVTSEKQSKARTRQGSGFDLKAKMAVSTQGFALNDILMSFESDGRPQLMTGAAVGGWKSVPRLKMNLSARWLDVDRILGGGNAVGPVDAARLLGQWVFALVLRDWDAEARLNVDQANLGNDVVGDIVVDVARKAGRELVVREGTAALPGGVRLRTSGAITGQGDVQAYAGQFRLYGGSLARFLKWVSSGAFSPSARSDRPFSLAGGIDLKADGFALREGRGELAGRPIKGAFEHRWSGNGLVAIVLDGDELDLEPFAPGIIGRLAARPLAFAGVGGNSIGGVAGAGSRQFDLVRMIANSADLRVEVRAGVLDDGVRQLRDVDASLIRSVGKLQLSRLRWNTGVGLDVEAEGLLERRDGTVQGDVKGFVKGSTGVAIKGIAEAIGAETPLGGLAGPALSAAQSLDAGFTMRFGGADKNGYSLRFDGLVNGRPADGFLSLAGGLEGWANGGINAHLRVEARGLSELFSTLGIRGTVPASSETGGGDGAADLVLNAVGRSADDVAVKVHVNGPDFKAKLDGQASVRTRRGFVFGGRVEVGSSNVVPVLRVLNTNWIPAIGKTRASGFVLVDFRNSVLSVAPQALAIGDGVVSGRLRFAHVQTGDGVSGAEKGTGGNGGRLSVNGDLHFGALTSDAVLGLISVRGLGRGDGEGDATPWSDGPLAMNLFDGISGDIGFHAKQLLLGDASVLRSVTGRMKIASGNVAVEAIKGLAPGGGTFEGQLALVKRPAGVRADARGVLRGVDLAVLMGGAAGSGGLSFEITGAGLSPRSVVSGLRGTGIIESKDVKISGIAAGAADRAAAAVLGKSVDSAEATELLLGRELRASLQSGRLAVGTRKIPFTIVDGAVRIAPFSVSEATGDVRNTTTIDLASLKLDSEWRIVGMQPVAGSSGRAARGPLPGFGVVYVGPLAAIDRIEPKIEAAVLERELTVLRMERSVERLEKLRREDDALARQEAIRLKALEEERRRALRTQGDGAASTDGPFQGRDTPPYRMPLGMPAVESPKAGTPFPRPVRRPRTFDPWERVEKVAALIFASI